MTSGPPLQRPDAFERAYREHAPRALAAAVSVLHDRSAAEDIVQDVFMHLWRHPGAFDPDRGALANYVSLLARSRAIDRVRSVSSRRAADERAAREVTIGRSSEPSAADPVIRREELREMISALAEVPAAQRQALMAVGHGLTSTELAGALGIPAATVKSRVRLGRRRLRAALEPAARGDSAPARPAARVDGPLRPAAPGAARLDAAA